MKKYLLVIWGDTDPELMGPYKSDEARVFKAQEIRAGHGDNNGLIRVNASGKVTVECFLNKETE